MSDLTKHQTTPTVNRVNYLVTGEDNVHMGPKDGKYSIVAIHKIRVIRDGEWVDMMPGDTIRSRTPIRYHISHGNDSIEATCGGVCHL